MNNKTKFLCALLMAFAAANVRAVPLLDLFDGTVDFLQVGNNVFDDWRPIDQLDPSAGPMELGAIDVTGVGDGTAGNAYGLNLAGNGQRSAVGDDLLSLLFGYSVSALDPAMQITGATMTGTTVTQGDEHLLLVEKDVFRANQVDDLAFLEIFSDPLDIPAVDLIDAAAFGGQDSVWIEDLVIVDGLGGSAELVSFQQRFVQSPMENVPEPATLPLFALGLLGYVLARRRQYRSI